MSFTAEHIWNKCLNVIKQNVTEQQFITFFKPIEFESYDEEKKTLLLQVPSNFIFEYLEEHFTDLLRKTLTREFGDKIYLTYRVLTDKCNNISQDIATQNNVENVKKSISQHANASPNIIDSSSLQEIDTNLNQNQTFDNFIEGKSNKLARSIGLTIAEKPELQQFNPMFIYGASGCGKTHLINAIGTRTKELYPQKRVLYVSARLFQKQYSDAAIKNITNDFINFYQTIDLLIVDDIQEWATAAKTQDTFFHIFNHLYRNGKRIILACDRPPVELKEMKERLLTRFCGGLIAELDKPNTELCEDILNYKIKQDGLLISKDVIKFIAQTANGSIRYLYGSISSLLAYSVVYNSEIDLNLAEKVIKRTVKSEKRKVNIEEITKKVCEYYDVKITEINGKSRKKNIVKARQLSMFLVQKHTKLPMIKIGKIIGNREHSTVIHSCTQIEKRLKIDKDFVEEVNCIEKLFIN